MLFYDGLLPLIRVRTGYLDRQFNMPCVIDTVLVMMPAYHSTDIHLRVWVRLDSGWTLNGFE